MLDQLRCSLELWTLEPRGTLPHLWMVGILHLLRRPTARSLRWRHYHLLAKNTISDLSPDVSTPKIGTRLQRCPFWAARSIQHIRTEGREAPEAEQEERRVSRRLEDVTAVSPSLRTRGRVTEEVVQVEEATKGAGQALETPRPETMRISRSNYSP
jgi:hypothetical protein